jgi:hypothetical protein
MLQIGATVRRVRDKELKKEGDSPLAASAYAAGKGVVSEIPFLQTFTRLGESLKDWQGARKFMGEQTKSLLLPPDVQRIAREGIAGKLGDVDSKGELVKRYPRGYFQTVEEGIPGLRRTLPAFPQGAGKLAEPKGAVAGELRRLGMEQPGVERVITEGGEKRTLPPEVYRDYKERVARDLYPELQKLVTSPFYQRAGDQEKRALIQRLSGDVKRAARGAVGSQR